MATTRSFDGTISALLSQILQLNRTNKALWHVVDVSGAFVPIGAGGSLDPVRQAAERSRDTACSNRNSTNVGRFFIRLCPFVADCRTLMEQVADAFSLSGEDIIDSPPSMATVMGVETSRTASEEERRDLSPSVPVGYAVVAHLGGTYATSSTNPPQNTFIPSVRLATQCQFLYHYRSSSTIHFLILGDPPFLHPVELAHSGPDAAAPGPLLHQSFIRALCHPRDPTILDNLLSDLMLSADRRSPLQGLEVLSMDADWTALHGFRGTAARGRAPVAQAAKLRALALNQRCEEFEEQYVMVG